MRARHWVRAVINVVNLSTPLGLLLARIGADGIARGPRGVLIARGYRLPLPIAPAFTVGNVVLLRGDLDLDADARLLSHEERHTTQYAWSLGPVMIVLYLCAAGISWLLSGDMFSYNPYERLAGLADGGYPSPPGPLRSFLRRRPEPPSLPEAAAAILPAATAPARTRGRRLVGNRRPPDAAPEA